MKAMPVTRKLTPLWACFTRITAAVPKKANGMNDRQPRSAAGSASGTVDQCIGIPKTSAAHAIVISPFASASRMGNVVIETTAAAAPNGETTHLSKVPATSSWRT